MICKYCGNGLPKIHIENENVENEKLGEVGEPILEIPINYCPECGKKLGGENL